MAESGLFDIAAHLHLTKKFGFRPASDMGAEIAAALDAIARGGMIVEVNTAGWYAPCGEVYPEPQIIRGCVAREIPLVVTADAHSPAHLTRAFARAGRLLRDLGCSELASYAGRQRFMNMLDAWE